MLLCWGMSNALFHGNALAQQPATQNKSWMDSISSGVKSGFSKVGNALTPSSKSATPAPSREDDAISLKSKSKAGPELYVAVARLYEQSGKPADAERQYVAALKLSPNYLPALLGYAQLKDRLGLPDDSLRLYEQAAKAYPREPSVYNNMGLCYARCKRYDQAVAAMARAVQLAPHNARYRNNIAAILVEQGRLDEAFAQLKEMHGEAAAYYNMGYLLNSKGRTDVATRYFSLALRADPSMTAAERWLQHLQRTATRQRLPQHPAAEGVKIIVPPPTEQPAPRRLPPIPSAEPATNGPALPGISPSHASPPVTSFPDAPMPPDRNPAVRPLPRTE